MALGPPHNTYRPTVDVSFTRRTGRGLVCSRALFVLINENIPLVCTVLCGNFFPEEHLLALLFCLRIPSWRELNFWKEEPSCGSAWLRGQCRDQQVEAAETLMSGPWGAWTSYPRRLPGTEMLGCLGRWVMGSLLLEEIVSGAGGTLGRSAYQLASQNHTAFKFGDVMIHPNACILTELGQENLTSNPGPWRAGLRHCNHFQWKHWRISATSLWDPQLVTGGSG